MLAHDIHEKSWQHLGHLRTAMARTGRYEEDKQTARAISAYAQYAYLLSLKMGSINQTRLDYTRLSLEGALLAAH